MTEPLGAAPSRLRQSSSAAADPAAGGYYEAEPLQALSDDGRRRRVRKTPQQVAMLEQAFFGETSRRDTQRPCRPDLWPIASDIPRLVRLNPLQRNRTHRMPSSSSSRRIRASSSGR